MDGKGSLARNFRERLGKVFSFTGTYTVHHTNHLWVTNV